PLCSPQKSHTKIRIFHPRAPLKNPPPFFFSSPAVSARAIFWRLLTSKYRSLTFFIHPLPCTPLYLSRGAVAVTEGPERGASEKPPFQPHCNRLIFKRLLRRLQLATIAALS